MKETESVSIPGILETVSKLESRYVLIRENCSLKLFKKGLISVSKTSGEILDFLSKSLETP